MIILAFSEYYPTPGNLPSPLINEPSLPLVSIVTPSYNQGQFIRETIESVLTQDYPNIEYWVIDGGSKDETLNILRDYEHDPRFHWISEPDKGQSDAINKGLARCQGEIFVWLNSDDMFIKGAFRHAVAGWQEIDQPAIVYGLARHIDENGKDLGYCAAQSPTMTFDKLLWVGKHNFVQPATFAPTDEVRKVGGVDISLQYQMDYDLWIKLAEHLPIKFIPHDLALYRLHRESKTVALTMKFIGDAACVLHKAADRGSISHSKAESRANLYGARLSLMPNTLKVRTGLGYLRKAVAADYRLIPEAVLIASKAAIRLVIGERFWAGVRYLKARFG